MACDRQCKNASVVSGSPLAHSRLFASLCRKLVARPAHVAWLPKKVSRDLYLHADIPLRHVQHCSTEAILCSNLHQQAAAASCMPDHPKEYSRMSMRGACASNNLRVLSGVQ